MKFSVLLMVMIMALSFLATVAAAEWQTMTVDPADDVGRYTSLALDSTGHPHISYYDSANGDLMYATWTGSEWQTETVYSTEDVGRYTSLALNKNGYPCISYYNNSTHNLEYVEYKPGTAYTDPYWSRDIVDATGDVGKYTSLAFDEVIHYPHISYYDETNGNLKYASWDGSDWATETAVSTAADMGKYTSLAMDGSGNPHISFYDETSDILKYTKRTETGWLIWTVDDDGSVGLHSSLDLDNSGNPHISYSQNRPYKLKYAKWTGSSWETQIVESNSYPAVYSSLALDSSGSPCIGYYGDTDLHFARWMGSAWQIQRVDSIGMTGNDCSLALDGSGNPHISYYDGTNYHLKYAKSIPTDEMGVFRPSTHTFYLDYNENGVWDGGVTDRQYAFGLAGDIPVSGDWDNNGITGTGVFRPSTHTFYLDYNENGVWDGAVTDRQYAFGVAGDIPVSGDWDSNGVTGTGVFRPSTHTFYIDCNENGVWDGGVTDRQYTFGVAGDIPVSGDWDTNGICNIGVFRPSTHTFYLDYNGNGAWNGALTDRAFNFGSNGDQPVSGKWSGPGKSCIGVFRPSTHTFYFDYNGNGIWDGAATDRQHAFGLNGDLPVSGIWG